MRHHSYVAAALAVAVLAPVAHAQQKQPIDRADQLPVHTYAVAEGSRLPVPGGTIWYRAVGNGTATPLMLLHGGPGISSVYLKSMEALADERIVVRYDQLGAGKSDMVTDTALFNIGHFVEELDSLRRALGLERIHLYGHSWGSILALEYYRAHPQHVASLVLASEVLDIPGFYANVLRLFQMLPDSEARAMLARAAGQPYDTAAFRAANRDYNRRYAARKPVLPEADTLGRTANDAIADHMNGTRLIKPNGTLSDYDARPFLNQIRVPVLFLVGEDDFVAPEMVRAHARLTPGARVVVIPASGHMMQWDNAPAHNEAVRQFLREVDRRSE